MKYYITFFAVWLALFEFNFSHPLNAADLVGSLPSEVTVDNKGAANLSIPLPLPSGRAGMQPELALVYNSNTGNGELGIGFSVSTGFPKAISRGRTILARDGVVKGVVFDSSDKLYLDGKRLICVSGTNGSPGSQYRTEVDSFVTIVAEGSSGEIETFVLVDKTGRRLTFGKVGSATDGLQAGVKRETSGADVFDSLTYSWALKRVQDVKGNAITFTYLTATTTHNESNLSKITYTEGPGISARVNVEFKYDQNTHVENVGAGTLRRDSASRYIAGRRFDSRRRLDAINVSVVDPDTNVSAAEYLLGYGYSPNGGPTRLENVKGKLRNSSTNALDVVPPTVLTWKEDAPTYTEKLDFNVIGTDPDNGAFQHIGDVTGDGYADVVVLSGSTITVYRSTGTGFAAGVVWANIGSVGAIRTSKIGDINGDGMMDIVFGNPLVDGSQKLYLLISNGSGFVSPDGGTAPKAVYTFSSEFRNLSPDVGGDIIAQRAEKGSVSRRITLVDLNGDGRDDLFIHRYDGKLSRAMSIGTGLELPQVQDLGMAPISHVAYYTRPLNSEVVFMGYIRSYYFDVDMMPVDINGDGLVDYTWMKTTSSPSSWGAPGMGTGRMMSVTKTFYALVNLGGGVFSNAVAIDQFEWTHTTANEMPYRRNTYSVSPCDVNGDGSTDFVILKPAEVISGKQMIRRFIYTSRASMTQPEFQADANEPVTEPRVSLDGTWVAPFFSKISEVNWGNDRYNSYSMPSASESLLLATAIGSIGDNFGVADLNHDGLSDYYWYNDEGGSTLHGWWVCYSQGSKFGPPRRLTMPWRRTPKISSGATSYTLATRQEADFNGDGIPDYTFCEADYGMVHGIGGYLLSSGLPSTRLEKVVNGTGKSVAIKYKPLSSPDIYTKGAAVSYPIREWINGTPVVSEILRDSGGAESNFARYTYQYSGNRMDLSGRGSLGFHSFVTIDQQTKIFKYQFLVQSFPMTGLTHREQAFRFWEEGGNVKFRYLNSHDNTVVFDEVSPGTGGYGTVFPFISKAVESRWENSDTVAHLSYARGTGAESKAETLFRASRPTDPHISISATSLFDSQTAVPTSLPGPFQLSDTIGSGVDAGANSVVGVTSFGSYLSGQLPRKITFGNLKELSTDYGDGYTEKVTTTYETASSASVGTVNVSTLFGLPKSIATTVSAPGYANETSPTKRFTYVANTPYAATETLDATNDDLDLQTKYTRDPAKAWRITTTETVGASKVSGSELLGSLTAGSELHIGTFKSSEVTEWDDRFDLPKVTKNAEPYSHSTTATYEGLYGLPTSVVGPNGEEVTTTYDALGRKLTVENKEDNITVSSTYSWDATQSVAPPAGLTGGLTLTSVYAMTVTTTQQPTVTTYYDRLGRPIRSIKTGFAGQRIFTDTIYNILGQVVAVSLPYKELTTAHWTKTEYDKLGRVEKVTAPNGAVTTNKYEGRMTTVTATASGATTQVNATLVDAKGRTVKVWNTDNPAGTVDFKTGGTSTASLIFTLDGFGRMRSTKLKDETATITATYDEHGRQTSLNDPDKGNWSYVNNALGQVVKQTDAKNTVTRSVFDRLGRSITRQITELAGPIETSHWYYYDISDDSTRHTVALGSKGRKMALQREEMTTAGAPGLASTPTSTAYYYTAKGKPEMVVNKIDGKFFYTNTTYDAYNRPWTVSHYWRPAGAENPATQPYLWQQFGYKYTYDGRGYLTAIQDLGNADWWSVDTVSGYDHLDRPVKVKKGNGFWTSRSYAPETGTLSALQTGTAGAPTLVQNWSFGYDAWGNLTSRGNSVTGEYAASSQAAETFLYDALNRLTHRNGAQIVSYEANGNIKTKKDRDFGTSYTLNYDAARPHAVATVSGAKTYSYVYDQNGNITSRTGSGTTVSNRWAGFDKPRWISESGKGHEYGYNAGRSRVVELEFDQMVSNVPSRYVRKRVYAMGPTLEVNYDNTASSGAPTWQMKLVRVYVPGPEGIIGVSEFDPTAPVPNAEKRLVYHYDHLGSISLITPYGLSSGGPSLNKEGKAGAYAYEPWGQRVNPATGSGAPSATAAGGPTDLTPRGFTGHEMLDTISLVHMNGRVYDPVIGRFLSADTFVQDAGDLQAYNRYSYVRNNPTSLNDPSGHFWSAVITAGFAAYDTYQYATGKQTGAEYARNMAVNGAALVADVATLGQGGGLGVRAAQVAARSEKAIVAIKNVAETIQKVDAVVSKAESAAHAVQAAASGDTKGALLAATGVIPGGGKATAAESKLEKNAIKAEQKTAIKAEQSVANEVKGGVHSETRLPVGDGKDSHHMPSRESNGGMPDNLAPAIKMDPVDHAKTLSNGQSGLPGAEFREAQGELWNSGDASQMRKAMANEIKDVRRAAKEASGDATKYNEGIQEMLEKAKENGVLPGKPPR